MQILVGTSPTIATSTFMMQVAIGFGMEGYIDELKGLAHLIEHLLLKGGFRNPTSRETLQVTYAHGVELNAETTQQWTNFHTTWCVDDDDNNLVVHGQFWRDSLFPPFPMCQQDLELIKGVVTAERYEKSDTANDIMHSTLLRPTLFPKSKWPSLSWNGHDELEVSNLKNFDVPLVAAYLDVFYQPANTTCIVVIPGTKIKNDQHKDHVLAQVEGLILDMMQHIPNQPRAAPPLDNPAAQRRYHQWYQYFEHRRRHQDEQARPWGDDPSCTSARSVPSFLGPWLQQQQRRHHDDLHRTWEPQPIPIVPNVLPHVPPCKNSPSPLRFFIRSAFPSTKQGNLAPNALSVLCDSCPCPGSGGGVCRLVPLPLSSSSLLLKAWYDRAIPVNQLATTTIQGNTVVVALAFSIPVPLLESELGTWDQPLLHLIIGLLTDSPIGSMTMRLREELGVVYKVDGGCEFFTEASAIWFLCTIPRSTVDLIKIAITHLLDCVDEIQRLSDERLYLQLKNRQSKYIEGQGGSHSLALAQQYSELAKYDWRVQRRQLLLSQEEAMDTAQFNVDLIRQVARHYLTPAQAHICLLRSTEFTVTREDDIVRKRP